MRKLKYCDLCGCRNFEFLFKGRDRIHELPGEYSEVRCSKCGLTFINPQPTEKELSRHYPEGSYYSLKLNRTLFAIKRLLVKGLYSRNPNPLLKLLLLPAKPMWRSVPCAKNGRSLDVGCGSGEFVYFMKLLGMDSHGVEPYGFDKEFARENKLDIFHGELDEAKYPSGYFDVITINHVLEHTGSPAKTLKELRRILKPGGILLVGVPQTNCVARALFGRFWYSYELPRHLFAFSTDNLFSYAEKAGLQPVRMRYNSTPLQFVGSLCFMLGEWRRFYLGELFNRGPLTAGALAFVVLSLLFLPLSYLLNILKQGDQVELVMTKRM